jgi:ribA/ribD-fused uncharacterized protein
MTVQTKIESFTGEYSFLSNFYPAPVFILGSMARTVEHGYQAAKTLNIQERNLILACKTAGQAKKLGKRVTLREDWEKVKVKIMRELVRQKFALPSMTQKLLRTGAAELIESNYWHDTFWGVDEVTGIGENHLGKILMQIREELKNERSSTD